MSLSASRALCVSWTPCWDRPDPVFGAARLPDPAEAGGAGAAPGGPARACADTRSGHRRAGTVTLTSRVSAESTQRVSSAPLASAVRRAAPQACPWPRAASRAPASAARSAAVAARCPSIRTLATRTAVSAPNQTRAHSVSIPTVPEPRSRAAAGRGPRGRRATSQSAGPAGPAAKRAAVGPCAQPAERKAYPPA